MINKLRFILLMVVLPILGCSEPVPAPVRYTQIKTDPTQMPHQWLRRIASTNEYLANKHPASVDYWAEWEKRLNNLKAGDQIWYWEESHGKFEGFEFGYCIIRGKNIIFAISAGTFEIIN